MTQDYAVQNQGPSGLVRGTLGAGVGALAGWGVSKIPALQSAKYSSWDDILKESKDLFEAAKKDGASDEVKNAAKAVREQMSSYNKAIKPTVDAVRNTMTTEATELANAKTAFKDLWNTKTTEIVGKIKSGDIKIKDFNVTDATKEEDIVKQARKYLRENMSDDLKTASTKLKEAANKFKVDNLKEKFSEDQKNTIKTKADEAWTAVKDKVKDLKAPKTLLWAGGLAAAGLVLGLLAKPKAKEQV